MRNTDLTTNKPRDEEHGPNNKQTKIQKIERIERIFIFGRLSFLDKTNTCRYVYIWRLKIWFLM